MINEISKESIDELTTPPLKKEQADLYYNLNEKYPSLISSIQQSTTYQESN